MILVVMHTPLGKVTITKQTDKKLKNNHYEAL